MSFRDDLARQSAQIRQSTIDSAASAAEAAAQQSAARDRQLTQFKQRFAEAVDFLLAEGVQPLRVVRIMDRGSIHSPSIQITKVFPVSTIPLGRYFLHKGVLYRGSQAHSHNGAFLRGIRRNEPVINVTQTGVGPGFPKESAEHEFVLHSGKLAIYSSIMGDDAYDDAELMLSTAVTAQLKHLHSQST